MGTACRKFQLALADALTAASVAPFFRPGSGRFGFGHRGFFHARFGHFGFAHGGFGGGFHGGVRR